MDMNVLLYTLGGGTFTFSMTLLGALMIFCFNRHPGVLWTKMSLGFAAGIMIAASIWSLLLPAIDAAKDQGLLPFIPAGGGFVLGALFLVLLDRSVPHLHIGAPSPEGPRSALNKAALLFIAVTIHNIPEGMAVGVSFSAAAELNLPDSFTAAAMLALGIGIQNIPEGLAVALPLHGAGCSRTKAFVLGTLSGLVEPIAAVICALLAGISVPAMPWLLAFAAGAMMYVVVEELIPESKLGESSDAGTLAVLSGFLLMMGLDTAFG